MDNKLQQLRRNVEQIDSQIIALIGERQKLAPQFARVKRELKLPLHQQQRELDLIKRYMVLGKKSNIPATVIQKIFPILFHASLERQRQLLKKKD